MKSKKILWLSILASFILTACGWNLQICPDELIDNKMPWSYSQYYLLDGERKELNDFDKNWLDENCDIVITQVS